MQGAFSAITIILFWVLMIVLGPYFTIMSLNVLFGTQIVFNIYSWLSCFWLGTLFIGWIKAGTLWAIKEGTKWQ